MIRTIIAAAALSLMAALPASAQTSPPEFTIDNDATLQGRGTAIVVTGTATCEAGDYQQVYVQLSQRSGTKINRGGNYTFQSSCPGGTQPWSVTVNANERIFKKGTATVFVEVYECGPLFCGAVNDTQTITVK